MKYNKIIAGFAVGMVGVLWMQSASAVPAFAAKYDKKCSSCHTAWPQLNSKGRAFKERGFRLESEVEEGTNSVLEDGSMRSLMSAFFVSRPYDEDPEVKEETGADSQVRAIHSVEIHLSGALDDNFSVFMGLEAEDELDFTPELSSATLAYRYSEAVNLEASWTQVFSSDPYGFLNGSQQLSRGNPSVIDQSFDGVDKMAIQHQNLTLTGRLEEKIFYSVSYIGAPADTVGTDASGFAARVAYDISDVFMVGGFYWSGSEAANLDPLTPPRDYDRTGLDFQFDFDNTRVTGGFVTASDDIGGGVPGQTDNTAISLQAFHTVRSKSGRPTWVPLVRYDTYEKNDGNDSFDEITFSLSYYFVENAKGFIEFWQQLDRTDGDEEDSRFTVQAQVGF